MMNVAGAHVMKGPHVLGAAQHPKPVLPQSEKLRGIVTTNNTMYMVPASSDLGPAARRADGAPPRGADQDHEGLYVESTPLTTKQPPKITSMTRGKSSGFTGRFATAMGNYSAVADRAGGSSEPQGARTVILKKRQSIA